MAALGLGFVGFVCRSIIRLPLLVKLLSLNFNLVFVVVVVVVFLFFFFGYGVDFWMDADCGGRGLAMDLGLPLNVDGLWWQWLTGIAWTEKEVMERKRKQ